ncbi:MAG: 4Fe-4S dicluster domain-containing protein [Lysobacterales bacterium]
MDRRGFLKTSVLVAGTTVAGKTLNAREKKNPEEFVGILVDTTRCIGCRACEVACSEVHDNFVPDILNDGALEKHRKTSEKQWTVVNKYKTDKGDVFVKSQCMHCYQAACSTACPTEAMKQTEIGPTIWRGNKCIGCRYCMISCPFNMVKYEFNEWNPKVQKCTMCFERLEEGQKPACVSACPTDALTFGTRVKNLEFARHRIYSHPDEYVHHIYGETEVGGTGYIYLSAVPFDQLGFPTDIGNTAYPEYTKEFLYSVPMVLFGAPAFLLGLNSLAARKKPDVEVELGFEDEGANDE